MTGLTPRQLTLLTFLDTFIKRRGYSPSFDEMRLAMGLASKSGVHRMIQALSDRGFVYFSFARRRSISVIRLPNERLFSLPDAEKLKQVPSLALSRLMLSVQSELNRRAQL